MEEMVADNKTYFFGTEFGYSPVMIWQSSETEQLARSEILEKLDQLKNLMGEDLWWKKDQEIFDVLFIGPFTVHADSTNWDEMKTELNLREAKEKDLGSGFVSALDG